MVSQTVHKDIYGVVVDLCARSVADFEAALGEQKEADAAEARRLQEEQERKAEEKSLEAEREAKERLERVRKREQARVEIEAVERELQAKKMALRDEEQVADDFNDAINNNNNNNNDCGSQSPADDTPVSHVLNVVFCF